MVTSEIISRYFFSISLSPVSKIDSTRLSLKSRESLYNCLCMEIILRSSPALWMAPSFRKPTIKEAVSSDRLFISTGLSDTRGAILSIMVFTERGFSDCLSSEKTVLSIRWLSSTERSISFSRLLHLGKSLSLMAFNISLEALTVFSINSLL